MEHNYTRIEFEKVIRVDAIITLFYMELSKSFCYEGERHNFWEMVYIDKGDLPLREDKHSLAAFKAIGNGVKGSHTEV